jgi:hypothetical protein
LTVTLVGFGTVAGAVYKPPVLIVPAVPFPPCTSFTNHVTAELKFPVPWTLAVNCWVPLTNKFALFGEIVTEVIVGLGGGGGGGGGEPPPPQLERATIATAIRASRREDVRKRREH